MSKRVLVCDDSKMTRCLVADILADDGWDVVAEAADGQEAVAAYKETMPDAMTLDLIMEGSDGLEALEGIRHFDPHAKIVVVTSVTHEKLIKAILARGVQDYITKPIVADRLLQSMSACIS